MISNVRNEILSDFMMLRVSSLRSCECDDEGNKSFFIRVTRAFSSERLRNEILSDLMLLLRIVMKVQLQELFHPSDSVLSPEYVDVVSTEFTT